MYEVDKSKVIITTIFKPNEVLSYIGSYLSFVGTLSLGGVAYWQNRKIQEESFKKDKIIFNLENEKMRLEYQPSFLAQTAIVRDWSIQAGIIENMRAYQMDKDKSYIYYVREEDSNWLDMSTHPIVPEERAKEAISIINCGNNTAHQVKFSMKHENSKILSDKSISVTKDEQVFLFISYDKNDKLEKNLVLNIRYFDTFQNVYEQDFMFYEENDEFMFKSYADVNLVKKSKMMNNVVL